MESGVTLVGGGSMLMGMAEALSEFLGIPSHVAKDPLTAVARGTGIYLDKLDIFSRVLSSDEDD